METCGHGTYGSIQFTDPIRTNCSPTGAIQALTDQTDFIPRGKSYFVHLKYIEDVTKQRIVVKGGEYIFIPVRLQKLVTTQISNYFIKINGGLKE